MRAALEQLRDEATDELATVEAAYVSAVGRRRHLIERIRACNRALAGTGVFPHGEAQRLWWPKGLPDPGEGIDDAGLPQLRGAELRGALVAVLETTQAQMNVNDLHRALVAHGFRPAGRASHAISNALATEVRAGRVVRVRRGWYRPASRRAFV
jgi:hypothetical protein